MKRDDFFRVDFLTHIGTADQSKVKFCLSQWPTNCGTDGMQFALTRKPVSRGKIDSPYNNAGNDNRYALQETVYADLFQCGHRLDIYSRREVKNMTTSLNSSLCSTPPTSRYRQQAEV